MISENEGYEINREDFKIVRILKNITNVYPIFRFEDDPTDLDIEDALSDKKNRKIMEEVESGLIGGNNPFGDPSFDNIPIRPSYKSLGPKLVGTNGLVTEIFVVNGEYYQKIGKKYKKVIAWHEPEGKFADYFAHDIVYIRNIKHEVEWLSCTKTRCRIKSKTTGEVFSMRSTHYFTLEKTDLMFDKKNIVKKEPLGVIRGRTSPKCPGMSIGEGFKVTDKWGSTRYLIITASGRHIYTRKYYNPKHDQ